MKKQKPCEPKTLTEALDSHCDADASDLGAQYVASEDAMLLGVQLSNGLKFHGVGEPVFPQTLELPPLP